MRSGGIALFAGLLGLAGCNQIFGLDAVILVDAGPDVLPVDAPPPTVLLTSIAPQLGTGGVPTHQADYAPMSPAPHVQFGEIGAPPTDGTYGSDGRVNIPYEYATRTEDWSFVFTPASGPSMGIPHEIQWHPPANSGFIVDQIPVERPALNGSKVITIAPGAPSGMGLYAGPYVAPRVYTSNAWTTTRNPTVAGGSVSFDYNAAGTVSQFGAKRLTTDSDDYLLIDYDNYDAAAVPQTRVNGCQLSQGGIDYHTDPTTPQNPTWLSTTLKYTVTGDTSLPLALATAYNQDIALTGEYKIVSLAGGDGVPVLHDDDPFVSLPLPLGAPLVECNMAIVKSATGSTYNLALPGSSEPQTVNLYRAATVQYAIAGTPVMTNTVIIGYDATLVAPNGTTTFSVSRNAPLATNIMLDGVPATVPRAGGGGSLVTLPSSTERTVTLEFSTVPMGTSADYYEATLYAINQGELTPIRVITFHESPLEFTRDLLVPGQLYIIRLRGVVGATNASIGDFRAWGSAQAISQTYTQTFQR